MWSMQRDRYEASACPLISLALLSMRAPSVITKLAEVHD